MLINKAYKFRAYPNNEQKELNNKNFKVVEFDQFKNEAARNQMEVLRNNKNINELEVLQQQVNDKYLIENK